MSRPLHVEYEDAWYYVMNRGRRRENIYTCKKLLESTLWQSMPGSKSFVEKIKERFFGEKTADYVPQSGELSSEIDRII